MRTRLSKLAAGTLALAALAFGGATLASAAGGANAGTAHASRSHPARVHDAARVGHVRVSQRAGKEDPGASGREGESGSAAESDNDADAQAAACQKAGIDPNATNVQYDDQTGVCSLDNGGSTGP